jgi:hypothetical protein
MQLTFVFLIGDKVYFKVKQKTNQETELQFIYLRESMLFMISSQSRIYFERATDISDPLLNLCLSAFKLDQVKNPSSQTCNC